MFGIILVSIISIFHIYAFWRFGSIPYVRKRVRFRIIGIGAAFLWSIFFLGRIYGHTGSSFPAAIIEFAGMIWMASLFLFTVAFLAVDLITLFGLFFRAAVPALRLIALVMGLLMSLVALFQGLRPPVITPYTVELQSLPDTLEGTVVAVVSDLHLGNQLGSGWMENRVTQIMAEKPSLILLLGDIYEGHQRPDTEILTAMKKLKAPLGVWGVLGNHEFYGGLEVIHALTAESGVKVLRNAYQEIRPGLVLAGVEGKRFDRRPDPASKAIELVLADVPQKDALIVMSHKPWQVESIAEHGSDLMLSGHTHGGQIWPFGYLVKKIFPMISGPYSVGDMTLIVCRGTGTWGPRMRLWQRGEILKITLKRKQI